jgi:hypothetical protein
MPSRRRLVTLLVLAACSSKSSSPTPAVAAAAADAGPKAIPLLEQLDKEAKDRPTGTPAAEQVLDALDAQGMHVDRRKQVVALTVKASYCLGAFLGHGPDAAGVAVCEYPDEAAAAAGREHALATFKAAGTRVIFVNKKTTLTLSMRGGDAGPDDALATRVKETFEKL